tara:strand:+ start:77689 stop:78255 length:567 start_codon:yes stop_codon:yes gene_type:complete
LDRYAVLGNPVNHSKSPVIHSAFAKQCKQAITYTAIHVEPGNFAQTVASFFEQGGKGLNVTVPFKQEAWALAEDLSADAQLAGAVNTLWMNQQGRLQGHNTDGIGLLRDIKNNHGAKLEQKKYSCLVPAVQHGALFCLCCAKGQQSCISLIARSVRLKNLQCFSRSMEMCRLADLMILTSVKINILTG